MTHHTQHFDYHMGLLCNFKGQASNHLSLLSEEAPLTEADHQFIETLNAICAYKQYEESMVEQGQWLVSRVVSSYPQLMPFLARDLLWFFGGDCLHFMPDDEISYYQQLDELRHAAESQERPFDITEAKAILDERRKNTKHAG